MNTKLRKHRSQMTHEEIDYTETLVHAISSWRRGSIDQHLQSSGRTFTGAEVLDALRNGQVIEVNSLGRVVFRSRKGICVVASVVNRTVVTVWYNSPNDNHQTLRRNEYTWRVNVIDYLRGLTA